MIGAAIPASALGAGARLHHVGIGVADLDAVASGLPRWHDPAQKVTVAFTVLADTTVEFVQPDEGASPVRAAISRNQRLLHLCFEVPDLGAAIAVARSHGFSVLQSPVPAVAFEGRRIAWLFSRLFGLVELLEVGQSCEP